MTKTQVIEVSASEVAGLLKHDWLDFEKLKASGSKSQSELDFYEGMSVAESHFKSKLRDLADYFEKSQRCHCGKETKFDGVGYACSDCGVSNASTNKDFFDKETFLLILGLGDDQ